MIYPLDRLAFKQGNKEIYMHKKRDGMLMSALELTAMDVNREKKVVLPEAQRKAHERVIEHGEKELEGITLANVYTRKNQGVGRTWRYS